MINGVLVERTVKDVVPALKTNSEGLRKVLEDLVKQYNSKQTEMEKWKVRISFDVRNCQLNPPQKKHNIQVVQQ
jgi:prefoldin subunit 2